MKAVIIDDEPLARNIIKEYLNSYNDIEIAGECNNGYEGVKAIQQLQPDLIFLDIQMPKINGFEMLELLDEMPKVIFTTAFDEYAIKAFEAHAADYLLKPFSRERFDKALQKVKALSAEPDTATTSKNLVQTFAESPQQSSRVVVKDGNKIKIIPTGQIAYFEAADDYVKIYTSEGCFLKNKTMAWFEKTLPQQLFVRIHRSYIANVQLITRIDAYEKDGHLVQLSSGAKLPASKAGYIKLKEVLGI